MAVKAPDAPAFPFLAGRDQKVPVIFGKPGDCRVYSVVFCVLSVLSIRSNRKYWYRVYSDNWCEQGGAFSGTSITFLKPFINTNYSFTGVSVNNSANGAANTITNITKTGITYYTFGNSGGRWKAEGYI